MTYTLGTLTFDDPLHQLQQSILHVDMDAFYASLAERDNPSLKGKPVIMARHPKDTNGTGIVSTANYIAREYGVHSGMSSWKAYQLCPQAEFIPVNHPYVKTVSLQIYRVFQQYSDVIQRVAYDEAYLQLPGNVDAVGVSKAIRQQIKDELNLTCSVGVSYNKLMAKIASDYNKPDGMTVIGVEDAVSFLDALDVKEVNGIGPRTVEKLAVFGVETVAELKQVSIEDLTTIFGSGTQTMLERLSGIDPRPVDNGGEARSSGNERTYHPFLQSNKEIKRALTQLIDKLGDTLKREELYGTTVVLKLRDSNFKNYSKRVSLDYLFHDKATLYTKAWELWLELRLQIMSPIRLVGVTLTGLDNHDGRQQGQGLLF